MHWSGVGGIETSNTEECKHKGEGEAGEDDASGGIRCDVWSHLHHAAIDLTAIPKDAKELADRLILLVHQVYI